MGQRETAKQIWDYFTKRGWSKEAVAAMLGNMQSESGIIADRWESDIVGNMSGGYGLVQWTPATKYINWAKQNGLVYQNVISQCKRIEWEVANGQQFYHPTMSFYQFSRSRSSPETLADIFIRHYERPANPNQPARKTQARYWFNQFNGSSTGGGNSGGLVHHSKKGRFTLTVDAINVRDFASRQGKVVATYTRGQSFFYDSYVINDAHVWLSYIGGSGKRRYVACGPYDNNPNNVWGTGF